MNPKHPFYTALEGLFDEEPQLGEGLPIAETTPHSVPVDVILEIEVLPTSETEAS